SCPRCARSSAATPRNRRRAGSEEGSVDMTGSIVDTAEWAALEKHFAGTKDVHLRTLFADDPNRGERMTAEAADLFLDYSKNRITDETVRLLVALAERAGLPGRIEAMFTGHRINATEDRAVLHVALRAPPDES